MPSRRRHTESTLQNLALWNFILAFLWGMWVAFWIFIIVFGVMTEKDEQEVEDVIVGGIILAFPGLACCLIHLLAGIGLLKQRVWGYYLHIAGAIAAAFTCIGILYTIFALAAITNTKSNVNEAFYPADYDDYDEPRRRHRHEDDYFEERRGRARDDDDDFDNRRGRYRREDNPDDY